MKKKSKLLCAALVLCMVIGLVPAIALADGEKPVYVVLGDSIAAAYGTEDYARNAGWKLIDDTYLASGNYAKLVTERLGYDVKMHAHCGWRVNEFLRIVNYCPESSDWFSDFMMRGLGVVDYQNVLQPEADAIPADLAKADVVTVCFGSNDIFSYALSTLLFDQSLLSSISGLSFPAITSPADIITALNSVKELFIGVVDVFKRFEDACKDGFESYKRNLPLMLEYLMDTATDAKIYMQSVESPVNLEIGSCELFSIDFRTFADEIAAEANAFLMKQCAQYDNVYFVDTAGTEYYGIDGLDITNLSFSGDDMWNTVLRLLKAVHPSEKGHEFIAEQFIAAIKRAEKAPEIMVGTNLFKSVTVSWKAVKGAPYYQVYRAEGDGDYKLVAATMAHRWVDIEASGNEGDYRYKVVASTDMAGKNKTSFSNVVKYAVVDVGFSAGIIARMLRNLTVAIMLPSRITEALTKTIANIIG